MRIMPDREMASTASLSALDEIAIRQQHGRFCFSCLDARGVDRHNVGPVGKVSNAAEALGLALGAISTARAVEAGKLGVSGWIDHSFDFQLEWHVRRLRNGEIVGRRDIAIGGQGSSVDSKRDQRQSVAIQYEWGRHAFGVWSERERCADLGFARIQRNIE